MNINTGMDELRRDRKDIVRITNNNTDAATEMAFTDHDFDVSGISGKTHIFNGAGITELTLPDAKQGRIIRLAVEGTGGVRIVPQAADTLSDGDGRGTIELYLQSIDDGAYIELECKVDLFWDCNKIIGAWTWEEVGE